MIEGEDSSTTINLNCAADNLSVQPPEETEEALPDIN